MLGAGGNLARKLGEDRGMSLDLVEAGRATRFQSGHRLSVGNRGGRPRKQLAAKLNRYSEFALDELYRKASDEKDPDRFDALRELARLTTPRRREVTGDSGEAIDARLSIDAFRHIAAEARAAATVGRHSVQGGAEGGQPGADP